MVVDPAEEWPHEVGELAFNPIFNRETLPDGRYKLSLQFPSTWFAYQNSDMYGYHGDGVECSPNPPLHNHANAEVRRPHRALHLDRLTRAVLEDAAARLIRFGLVRCRIAGRLSGNHFSCALGEFRPECARAPRDGIKMHGNQNRGCSDLT